MSLFCKDVGVIPYFPKTSAGAGGFGEVFRADLEDFQVQNAFRKMNISVPPRGKIVMKQSTFYPREPAKDKETWDYSFGEKQYVKEHKARENLNKESKTLAWLDKHLPDLFPAFYGCVTAIDSDDPSKVIHAMFMANAGRSLLDWMKEEGVTAPMVDYLSRYFLHRVAQLHKAGLVHADLKPHNLAVDTDHPYLGFPTFKMIDAGSMCRFKNISSLSVALCMSPAFTEMYTRADLHVAMGEWMKKRDFSQEALACLARIHDWYGLIGTTYVVLQEGELLKPKPKNWHKLVFGDDDGDDDGYDSNSDIYAYPAMVDTLLRIFTDKFKVPLYVDILNLPVKDLVDHRGDNKSLRSKVVAMCEALDDIDAKALLLPTNPPVPLEE